MTVEEFQTAVQSVCLDKEYDDLPSAFKQFITAMFNTIDTDGQTINTLLAFHKNLFQGMGS